MKCGKERKELERSLTLRYKMTQDKTITKKEVIKALNTLTIFCIEHKNLGFEASVQKGDVEYTVNFKIEEFNS